MKFQLDIREKKPQWDDSNDFRIMWLCTGLCCEISIIGYAWSLTGQHQEQWKKTIVMICLNYLLHFFSTYTLHNNINIYKIFAQLFLLVWLSVTSFKMKIPICFSPPCASHIRLHIRMLWFHPSWQLSATDSHLFPPHFLIFPPVGWESQKSRTCGLRQNSLAIKIRRKE